jgi:hypothetical protein
MAAKNGTTAAVPAPPAAAGAVDHFSMSARPTCPSVLIPFENQLYALPVQKLVSFIIHSVLPFPYLPPTDSLSIICHDQDVAVEFNVSTAFIKITGVWKNIAKYKVIHRQHAQQAPAIHTLTIWQY